MAGDVAMQQTWNKSSLKMMLVGKGIAGLFENCKYQYAYNQRQKIYSAKVSLDNRPRILTLRIGQNFMELSLTDQDGNVLEVAREEDGRGVTFSTPG